MESIGMRKVNLKDVPDRERHSPKGKFGVRYKDISVALGRDPKSFDLMLRHPFDLTVATIPKGKTLCPYHSHSAEWEFYLVISGQGTVRHKDGQTEVGPGDAFLFGPDEAHSLMNTGEDDFVYYVIADNPVSDSCFYPDSNKFAVWKDDDYVIVKGDEVDYNQGEE